jgi:hypothetical protein
MATPLTPLCDTLVCRGTPVGKHCSKVTFIDDSFIVHFQKQVIYKPLVNGLRPMASRKGLSPSEILSEWKLYATMEDLECEGKCVCVKIGLRYLVVKDQIPRSRVTDTGYRVAYIVADICLHEKLSIFEKT